MVIERISILIEFKVGGREKKDMADDKPGNLNTYIRCNFKKLFEVGGRRGMKYRFSALFYDSSATQQSHIFLPLLFALR